MMKSNPPTLHNNSSSPTTVPSGTRLRPAWQSCGDKWRPVGPGSLLTSGGLAGEEIEGGVEAWGHLVGLVHVGDLVHLRLLKDQHGDGWWCKLLMN